MNIDDPERSYVPFRVERRVLEIQAKLHRWSNENGHRRFDDLYNLVCDPDFLLVAWDRVRSNRGARSAGIDGRSAFSIESAGVEEFLGGLRSQLKDRSFSPLPARERMIPKSDGKKRRLGIATVCDRVVQASLKLVLEPIFEADFLPCSYGFRPNRRAHDAVAEIRYYSSRPRQYEWVVEGDIKACFDEISHSALMDRVRMRVGDKRVLALVKAFLKSGILSEDGSLTETNTGTPQGSILSPLLSNVALSVLDEYIEQAPGGPSSSEWQRRVRRRQGLPNFRLIRYADDWCLMVRGTREGAEALKEEVAEVLATMGLRLADAKTLITHIDEGLDFLGWRIQRHVKASEKREYVYTYPARKALRVICRKVKRICRNTSTNQPLSTLLYQLNPVLRGWCAYFRPGVSSKAFGYLAKVAWYQVIAWIRRKHRGITWKELRRRYCAGGWQPRDGQIKLLHTGTISTTRYRYRGTKIPSPWAAAA
ncbi:group II intron reverse transcriptase/maturase [Streptomyces sp. CMB-StM0423]|uniref:group II intron reverse transcriptase/maturase n=1 Tax=Streptomyces sp. CMB-StM0423 TaxID=2059884 RepID=UPI000C70FDE2|nr:group II intron reverse transcriptase/maturase [Streptomyces sp. CMB-StM0423]AUH40498.1 group II intron reverse transcriptase/maturase [Streptomyces sp. CMB-StM0423]AUH42331.1 group II intron reverse transcriptase/maturase [Streptomyces sp. CMB-StM0423]AUH42336.1 group II intron reverse transcriptase/maturase [Streptomyces sp. CMB-StM0423]